MSNLPVKPMSSASAWLILVGLLFSTAVTIYWPLNDFRNRQLQSISNLNQLISKKLHILSTSEEISSGLIAVKKEIKRSGLVIISSPTIAINQFQSTVRQISKTHNLALTQMQILKPKERGNLSQLLISVDGFSSLTQLHDFLVDIENNKPLIKITNANIVPVGDYKGIRKLNFNFELTMLNGTTQ